MTFRVYLPASTWEVTYVATSDLTPAFLAELVSADIHDDYDLAIDQEAAVEEVRAYLRDRKAAA